jgi:predicted DNA-binding antitoxin AbrB/MazE fold protein
MPRLEIEATYDHGTLKLSRELPLQQGQKVTVTIHLTASAAKRLSGLINWQGSQEDLEYLAESDDNHHWAWGLTGSRSSPISTQTSTACLGSLAMPQFDESNNVLCVCSRETPARYQPHQETTWASIRKS